MQHINSPASLKDLERFGIAPKAGSLYTIRNCQCSEEYIVECSGSPGKEWRAKSECPFCHGVVSLRTGYPDVRFIFEPGLK